MRPARTQIEIIPALSAHVEELGRICYEAFRDLTQRRGMPLEMGSVRAARAFIGRLVENPAVYGAAALFNGELAGSCFVQRLDEVAAIGPVTVDPSFQGQRIGRTLVDHALHFARPTGEEPVRLLQDGHNADALSLYATLGFAWRDALAAMLIPPVSAPEPSVRRAVPTDLPAMDELCRKIFHTSRRHEIEQAMQNGPLPLIVTTMGQIRGYLIPTVHGHGVGETPAELLALIRQAHLTCPSFHGCICPLSEPGLFRLLLDQGFRTVKIMNVMSLGPYASPTGPRIHSILY